MARTETPSFNNTWERIGHAAHEGRLWARLHRGRLALTIAALGAAAGAAVSVIVFRPEDRSDTQIQPATGVSNTIPDGAGVAITIPTETPLPTATAEPTKTPTPTPEVKQDVPCLILPQEYCSQADWVIQKSPSGQIIAQLIGLRLPPGVPVFLPANGQVTKTEINNHPFLKGYQATVFDPKNPDKLKYIITGDLKFPNLLSLNMKAGEIFGYSQNTGKNMADYNLIFYVADISPNNRQEVINEEIMRKMFPAALTKPPREITYENSPSTPGNQINTTIFLETPPAK